MQPHFIEFMPSPMGDIQIEANELGLLAIRFVDHPVQRPKGNTVTQNTLLQLQGYFAGQRHQFSLPLAPVGTPFQMSVWRALQTIRYGEVASYSDIARVIGSPKAVRAVGAANSKNPISIVVPCHRIIGKNGTLTGYAGGLDRKRKLLALENSHAS